MTDPEATCLPFPIQLKRRMLIKHKKLEVSATNLHTYGQPCFRSTRPRWPQTSSSRSIQIHVDDHEYIEAFMSDLINQRKNRYLYMQDPIDKVSMWGYRHAPLSINCISSIQFMWTDMGETFLYVDGWKALLHTRAVKRSGGDWGMWVMWPVTWTDHVIF